MSANHEIRKLQLENLALRMGTPKPVPAAAKWVDGGYLSNGCCPYMLGYGRAFCSKPYGHEGEHTP